MPKGMCQCSNGRSKNPLALAMGSVKNTIYHSNSNIVYSCKYHVVWCPKYRRKVLTNGVDVRLKELLQESIDIVPDEDGNLMVMGVRILTEFSDTDTTPNTYLRDVTFELKKTSVIGLSGVEGFTNEYVLVITYKHNLALNESVDLYNYKPQQLAYGDSMTMYGRIAQEGNAAWNNWFPISSVGGGGGGNNFIVSDSEPQDQEEGDYWAEPLD